MINKPWGELLNFLDVRQLVPRQTKSGGAIEFWREWDASRGKAVWVKRYISNDSFDLRAFNAAEIEWLMQLAGANVINTYRRASFEQEGTKLAEPASTTIKTFDCGPTLDDWLRMPVRMGGRVQAHCFVQPELFLRMAQFALLTVEQVNARHFIHCDLHPGNITLPLRILELQQDRVHILPLWDNITLIDFGYSIDSRRAPKTTLPILHTGADVRISPHLQSILKQVETQAMSLLQPSEAWANVWLDPSWWYRLESSPLEAFRSLDWREDLYQLGCTLRDIRDGVGMASHLEGRTVRESTRVASVDGLVNELPEQLIHLGISQSSTATRPHQRIADQIQRALYDAKFAGIDFAVDFELHQVDYPLSPAGIRKGSETPLRTTVYKPPAPAWTRHVPDLDLPLMKPLRLAAHEGWQLMVASTPVTWRQWQSACKHNPTLYCPDQLTKPHELFDEWLDTAVTQVSYLDCLAYVDTINHLKSLHAAGAKAMFCLPSAEQWSLLVGGHHTKSAKVPEREITDQPVSNWHQDERGLAGVHHHLWQWQSTTDGATWAPVRGGCAAQSQRADKPDGEPLDQYPVTYRSRYITLRLVCCVAV